MPKTGELDYKRPKLLRQLRLRRRRQGLLWRAFRARRQLKLVQDQTDQIASGDILLFAVVRNEETRLPHFLEYYRALGVEHFLIVDNASNDGTRALLADQSNVSIWETKASYRASRFGMDWVNRLLAKYGHGHWCLTVDADELLVFPKALGATLPDLVGHLERNSQLGFGALMLDMAPEEALGTATYSAGQDPIETLPFFDPGPYRSERQSPLNNMWVQGGLRERKFFADRRRRSPTLNKIPLMKWNRRWAYVISTHSILPPKLNMIYDGPSGETPSGALLHTKFLPEIVSKSEIEKQRGEHFTQPELFDGYYDEVSASPVLWDETCIRYEGPDQLEALGLISVGKGAKCLVRDKDTESY
ncbi:MAG: glycosyltransferase family 2 protein [Cognatishimia sp.]|nr:glycosyltransferase family 2 protein [Cognatishimia sp.]